MSDATELAGIVTTSLRLIRDDVAAMKPDASGELHAKAASRLTQYLRALLPLSREVRPESEDGALPSLTDAELAEQILAEAERLRRQPEP